MLEYPVLRHIEKKTTTTSEQGDGEDLLSRRSFLKHAAVASGAALFALQGTGETQRAITRPIGTVVRYKDAQFGDSDFNVAKAKRALDESMCALFKVKNPVQAWTRVVDPMDVVAVKVNCLGGPNLSTRPGLVDAITQSLVSAGVKPDNIIVFDRKNSELIAAGFALSQEAGKPRIAGTDALGGYETNLTQQGTIASRLAKVIATMCTAIINVPILKDHSIVGVSAGLKNYYGVIDNPNKYHTNHGDPHVVDVNSIPSVRGKDRLTICDALNASFHGGPYYNPSGIWQPSSILVATDPVALDYVAWYMIETERKNRGLKPLAEEQRSPTYIFTAASAGMGIRYPKDTKLIDLSAPAT